MNLSKNSAVVVTGGAGGLGREICLAAASRGARVWVTDVKLEGAKETAELCRGRGAASAEAIEVDVRSAEQVGELASKAAREGFEVDLLVNNAGVAVAGQFVTQTLEHWRWITDVNYWGVVHGCHFFLPAMLERKRGAILNIASSAGLLNPANLSSYNVTKAAVIALSETLHSEYRKSGITITVAAPTFFETDILKNARISDPEFEKVAHRFFEHSQTTAADVARACLQAIERGTPFVLPSWDARLFWAAKRAAPRTFAWAIGGVAARITQQK